MADDPIASALAILRTINAPPRLLKHGALVAEAAQLLVDATFERIADGGQSRLERSRHHD